MKKIFYTTTLFLFLFFGSMPFGLAAERSFLYDYDGNVILMRDGVGQTLKTDITIHQGDVLKTDTNATADVIMNQLAGLRFYGGSECLFDNIRTGSMHLILNEGGALLNLKAMPSTEVFSFETPAAVIQADVAVQFSCKINGEGDDASTTITVKKGGVVVQVKSSGAAINVLQNQALDVSSKTFISAPRNISEEENEFLRKVNSVISGDEETS